MIRSPPEIMKGQGVKIDRILKILENMGSKLQDLKRKLQDLDGGEKVYKED